MKIRKLQVLFFVFCLLCFCSRSVYAKKKVSTFLELKELCETESNQTIEIVSDIILEEPIVIRGNKVIRGNGHRLVRSGLPGKVYGGCLFLIQGKKCKWENITVSGNAKNKNTKDKVFGRIVEVRQGTFVIGRNCTLRDNINEKLSVNGGGAVEIDQKGTCVMEAGLICNNKNVSGGAGFYVKKGGKLVMSGGRIVRNKTKGIAAVEGFDGRGGAIFSEGNVVLKGGVISENTAAGYYKGGSCYGGAGGAIYATSSASLLVMGGGILKNSDDVDRTIWVEGRIALAGNPEIERIYLSKSALLKANHGLNTKKSIAIETADCTIGKYLVSGSYGKFLLYDGDTIHETYYLVRKKKGFLIEKKKITKKKITKKRRKKSGSEIERNESNDTKKELPKEPKETKVLSRHKTLPKPKPQETEIQRQKKGHVRFVEPDSSKENEEVWYFSREEIQRVKEYLSRQKNPFSEKMNQEFMRTFEKSKGKKE